MSSHTHTRTNFTTRSTCVCVGRVRSPPAVLDARAPCTLSPHPADVAAMPKKAHAKQQMPMCTYGLACTRKGCVYRHPPRTAAAAQKPSAESVEPCKPFIAGICQFGSRCHNYHPPEDEVLRLREKYARMACKWGDKCRSEACLYSHPSDADFVDPLTAQLTTELSQASLVNGLCQPINEQQQPWQQQQQQQWRQETTCDVSDVPFEPKGLENLPSFPRTREDEAPEGWHPNAAAEIWRPGVSAAEWVPSSSGGRSADHSNHSEWQPDAAAAEWTPSGVASATSATPAPWQPSPRTAEWAPPPSSHATSLPPWSDQSTSAATTAAGTGAPASGTWAAMANTAARLPAIAATKPAVASASVSRGSVRMPQELWLADVARIDATAAFAIADPLTRFRCVNEPHERRAATQPLTRTLPRRGGEPARQRAARRSSPALRRQ